jgi:hypothetical protein
MAADDFIKLPLMAIPFCRVAPWPTSTILFCVFSGRVYHEGRYSSLATSVHGEVPDKFYKKESQEKTLLQRPEFFLLPSPHD